LGRASQGTLGSLILGHTGLEDKDRGTLGSLILGHTGLEDKDRGTPELLGPLEGKGLSYQTCVDSTPRVVRGPTIISQSRSSAHLVDGS